MTPSIFTYARKHQPSPPHAHHSPEGDEDPEGEGDCCKAERVADVEYSLDGVDGGADVVAGRVGDGVEAVVVEGAA